MKKKEPVLLSLYLFLFLSFSFYHGFSQDPLGDFAFIRKSPLVYHTPSVPLDYPWAGGMNSVRFSEIDLNLDGIKDLFIFEKNGNRILPFIHDGNGKYSYAPEYVRKFPPLHDWVILTDYNNDHKEDIFCYGLAGVMVYKNSSVNTLSFELVTDQLNAFYYNGYSNLFASPNDYLTIKDIDGDGYVDILNFGPLGKHVHYLKNYTTSSELFDFRLEDNCWGKFSEGAENNVITLNTTCPDDQDFFTEKKTRHVGSTLFALDYTGNGLIDLVVGDVDYPNLILLTNGGSTDLALMTRQDSLFPNSAMPVDLFSMPAINYIDINGDGRQELLVSPSDPSFIKSRNINSVWLYESNRITQEYELTTTSFLQEEMIDVGGGAYPVLFDWDGDGLDDLFIGNYGYYDTSYFDNGYLQSKYSSAIAYYKNTGTRETPQFQLITNDFGELRKYGYLSLYPAFGDFTGNGKIDILCGTTDSLILFINESDNNDPLFSKPGEKYQNINAGQFLTPQYFDIDNDGKKDLLIGNRRGLISFYKNVSTTETPRFEWISDRLGNVDVRDFNTSFFGYSVPHFFRDQEGKTTLFCGSEQGEIFYYKDIDNRLTENFTFGNIVYELDSITRYLIKEGSRVAPVVGDLNSDGKIDLLVGNWAGGVAYFEGVTAPDSTVSLKEKDPSPLQMALYPNPCTQYTHLHLHGHQWRAGSISIFDLTGREVKTLSFNSQPVTISTAGLSRGIYLIQIKSNGQVFHEKLVKL